MACPGERDDAYDREVESAVGRPVTPRPAASVAPLRDTAAGLEVLLLERHADSPMSPGAYAFPGGRVEAADSEVGAGRSCRGLDESAAAATLGDVTPPRAAVAFWIAALREAFEETGLLLAYRADGTPFAPEPAERPRFTAHRARCRADAAAFLVMLRAEGLTLATDRMAYWARWITPEERPLRYDARFFVAASVAAAPGDPDGRETVACRWLSPAAALEQHRAGAITLPVPTREILRSIAGAPDVTTLLETARRREIHSVRPRVVREGGAERILLPGDPGYF
jgi:8-oxo-dGTP pyrophosphatase MutT (NUDIX family)